MTRTAAEIDRAIRSGTSPAKTARRLGVSRQYVYLLMRRYGILRVCLRCRTPLASSYRNQYCLACRDALAQAMPPGTRNPISCQMCGNPVTDRKRSHTGKYCQACGWQKRRSDVSRLQHIQNVQTQRAAINHYKRWSPEDDARILAMDMDIPSVLAASELLGRSKWAVTQRRTHLRRRANGTSID